MGITQSEDGKIWLTSLHGKSKPHQRVLELQIKENNEPVSVTFTKVNGSAFISGENSGLKLLMSKDNTLIMDPVQGSFSLSFIIHPQSNFEYNTVLKTDNQTVGVINSYKSLTKYLIYSKNHPVTLTQDMHYDSTGSRSQTNAFSTFELTIESSDDRVYLEECLTNFHKPTFPDHHEDSSFEDSLTKVTDQLNSKEFNEERINTIASAVDILLTNTVEANELLTCEATLASINGFPSVYSWDNGFISLGTMLIDSHLGFNQLKATFDHQDPWGQLPGSVSDTTKRWNFSKPPTAGIVILEMLKHDKLDEEEAIYLYNHLLNWVTFYIDHRQSDDSGCFFYSHGNDSGMDNSTVFRRETTIETPDLSAYLILCIESLEALRSSISDKSSLVSSSFDIVEARHTIESNLLNHLTENNDFVARDQITKEIIPSDSLLLLTPLLLKNESINSHLVSVLKHEFLTDYGIATEKTASPYYQEDAYWRGAIWAPSTTLMVLGLERNGYQDLAEDIMADFCCLVETNGFYENYGALTGKGLRDENFSWTASVYLYFIYKLYGR